LPLLICKPRKLSTGGKDLFLSASESFHYDVKGIDPYIATPDPTADYGLDALGEFSWENAVPLPRGAYSVSKDFEVGMLPTLLPEDSIELDSQVDTFVIKDASEMLTNFVAFDLEASNGTVHTIDKILIPKKVLAFVSRVPIP